MSFAVAQYRSAGVETASPVQVVVQLYDGALKFLRQAEEAIARGDAKTRGAVLTKAHAVVSELQSTLDNKHAPDLCNELDRLYEFVLHRITQAALSDDAPLTPAINVLSQLRGAWAELAGLK